MQIADQLQCLYSAEAVAQPEGGGAIALPLACRTKCRIRKITRFKIFEIVFCPGIDSRKELKHILKRLFRGGANSSKIKLINKKKKLEQSQKSVFKFDRILKNPQDRFNPKIYKLRKRGWGYSVLVNYQSLSQTSFH